MKLLGSHGSPYARKARIAMLEKNVPCEFVPARAADPGSLVPQYNPLSKVPVLVLDNNKGMIDSSVIVEYFDGIGSGAKLLGSCLGKQLLCGHELDVQSAQRRSHCR